MSLRDLETVAGLGLLCAGVAFLVSWPAALIVAGVLLLIDRLT